MTTIDQLAPATASSDADEMMASQNGVAVKVTRAQVIAGLQPALSIPSGTVLGRASSGAGAPEMLTVGANLIVHGGTLSATSGYVVSLLPAGASPAIGDLVAMSQGGTNTAVPYAQFISSLSEVPGLDASQMLVTPTGSSAGHRLADFAAGTLPTAGGTMAGALMLAGNPTTALQAVPKQYVDSQAATALPMAGGTMTGGLTLASGPAAPLQAATKDYVDTQVGTALPMAGGTMTGLLALASDPVAGSQAATKRYVDGRVLTSLPIAGGTMTGALTLAGNPSAPLQAASKQYVDTQAAAALPVVGGTMTGELTLASDPAAPLQAATKEYVDTQVGASLPKAGGTMTGLLVLASDPVASSQAATKHYVDSQVLASLPMLGGTMTGALTLVGNPTAPLQAVPKQYVDIQSAAALPVAGGTMTGALTLAGNPNGPLQAAAKQYVDMQAAAALPVTGGTMTGALMLAADPTAALQASTKEYVDAQAGAALSKSGGTMTGALLLSADPVASSQAATKSYVDSRTVAALPIAGGTLTGSLALAPSGTVLAVGPMVDVVATGSDDTALLQTALNNLTLGISSRLHGHFNIVGTLAPVTMAGVSATLTGDAPQATTITIASATDGPTIMLARSGAVWGKVSVSNLSFVRGPVSPVAANIGLKVYADPSAGVQYLGYGLCYTNLWFYGSSQGVNQWFTALELSSLTAPIISNILVFSPAVSTADGGDSCILLDGSSFGMFGSGFTLANCLMQGGSCGVRITGYVQGVSMDNFDAEGQYFGINWIAITSPRNHLTTAASGLGVLTLNFAPGTIGDIEIGDVVNGPSVPGQAAVLSVSNSTGVVTINQLTTGSVPIGTSISFQTRLSAENLQISNSAFNAAYRDIYCSWVSGISISGSSGERFTTNAPSWAWAEFDECAIIAITGNALIQGLGTGTETGIILSSTGTQGSNGTNSIVGNAILGLEGDGIYLKGTTASTIVTGNNVNGVSGLDVRADLQGSNIIHSNMLNQKSPLLTMNVGTRQLQFGNGTGTVYVSLNGGSGDAKTHVFQTAGLNRWTAGSSNDTETGGNAGSSYCLFSYSDGGSLLGTPLSISRATSTATFGGPIVAPSFTFSGGGGFGANTAGALYINMNAASGYSRVHVFQTAGSNVWSVGVINDAQSGGNVGASWGAFAYSDAGGLLGASLLLTRSNLGAEFGGAISRQGMSSSAPSSGGTVQLSNHISDHRILGSSTIAVLTVQLPAGPPNGQTIRISSQVAIASLTVTDSAGGTSDVQTAPVALPAGGAFSVQWNAAASAWWCSVGS